MSYSFNGAGTTYLRGTLTTAINIGDAPITIAAWFKTSSTDTENAITAFSSDTGTVNNSLMLYQGNPGSYLTARSTSTTGATNSATATTPGFVDAGWFPGIALFNATNDRDIYYGPSATMGDFPSTTPNDAGTGMDVVTVGVGPANSQKFTGLIAEVCIWNKALSTEERAAFCGGTDPSTIAASNLVGYWPLSADNATQSNLGTDAGGDLTVTSATYSSDHPDIEVEIGDLTLKVSGGTGNIYMTWET